MSDERNLRFDAVTVEVARMQPRPGDVIIVRIPERSYSNQLAAQLHKWMRADLPDNRVWVLPGNVDITVLDAADADRIEIPCTCSTYPAPHAADCAITMALPRPVACACGDQSGIPHLHPQWSDPSPRILSAQQARDGRHSEIRETADA